MRTAGMPSIFTGRQIQRRDVAVVPAVDVVEHHRPRPAGVHAPEEIAGEVGALLIRGRVDLHDQVVGTCSENVADLETRSAEHALVRAEAPAVQRDGAVDGHSVEHQPRCRQGLCDVEDPPEPARFEALFAGEGVVAAHAGIGDPSGRKQRRVDAAGHLRGDRIRPRSGQPSGFVALLGHLPDAVQRELRHAGRMFDCALRQRHRLERRFPGRWPGAVAHAVDLVEGSSEGDRFRG